MGSDSAAAQQRDSIDPRAIIQARIEEHRLVEAKFLLHRLRGAFASDKYVQLERILEQRLAQARHLAEQALAAARADDMAQARHLADQALAEVVDLPGFEEELARIESRSRLVHDAGGQPEGQPSESLPAETGSQEHITPPSHDPGQPKKSAAETEILPEPSPPGRPGVPLLRLAAMAMLLLATVLVPVMMLTHQPEPPSTQEESRQSVPPAPPADPVQPGLELQALEIEVPKLKASDVPPIEQPEPVPGEPAAVQAMEEAEASAPLTEVPLAVDTPPEEDVADPVDSPVVVIGGLRTDGDAPDGQRAEEEQATMEHRPVAAGPAENQGPEQAQGQGIAYRVRQGDTLMSIARAHYGGPEHWRWLVAANPDQLAGEEPSLQAGMVLTIPSPAAMATQEDPPGEAADDPVRTALPATHTVQEGETLYSIARQVYGDGNRWQELLELNRDQLAGPQSLAQGMVLKIEGQPGQLREEAAVQSAGR